jgi:transposase
MANKTISMSKLRQIIRLKEQGISNRKLASLLGVHRETVRNYTNQMEELGLSYQELLEQEDLLLENLFVKHKTPAKDAVRLSQMLDYYPTMEKELGRVGVDKWNLWLEYKEKNNDGYAYSHFCREYNRWHLNKQVSAHFEHKAGDKIYVDYTGSKLHIVDRKTGEIQPVDVLVVLLGYSQYTYVEASISQKKGDFIASVENALHYFGGVPSAIVTDNLKSAVTKSCKYEPKVNETFESFALHYNTVILPTRAYKPKDKALVEGAVKIVYKRIFAPLRDRVFFTLSELNQAIKEELEKHNALLFKGKDHSRKQLYLEVEKQTLHPLASSRYELQNYNWQTVHKNSHVYLSEDKHYYSVPYKHISQKVKVVYTRSSIEIYANHERIAAHKREIGFYKYTTEPMHMPSTHRFVSEWNPERFISWAKDIGEPTKIIIEKILETKSHPEQSYKACLGVLSFAKKVGKERLNNACDRAMYYQSYGYQIIKNILTKGLDKEPIQLEIPCEIPNHDNIRGEVYYY